jgi:thioredoxin reductase (NADPH)
MFSEETLTETQLADTVHEEVFELVIIGAGPAGMSAALCAGRANTKTLLIDMALPGGEASTAYQITNYMGFPGGIHGDALAKQMEDQLKDFDIEHVCAKVEDILQIKAPIKMVKTDMGVIYKTKYIILSVGLEPKKMGEEFEQKFLGRGISYYAQGDVESYTGKDVAVIGGGNCACYAADYLSKYVKNLYLIHHADTLKAVKNLKESVLNNPKIKFVWNSRVTEIFGLEKVEKIKLESTLSSQSTWIDVKCVFVYVGRIPPSTVVSLDIEFDEDGYIITDQYMRTNIPGIYAAGDICAKQIRQIATAVSDGMIAAVNIGKELSE